MKRWIALIALVGLAACSPQGTPAPSPPADVSGSAGSPGDPAAPSSPPAQDPQVEGELVTGLRAPWSVVPLGDDKALISQRDSAEILLLDAGATTVAATVPGVVAEGEGGLLGLAMSGPDAARVFVYYTSTADNRVTVFDFDGERLTNERPVLTGIPKGFIHNGGRIAFGPDGYLYVATGEIGRPDLAQDPGSPAGKILRIRRNGRPAPGNPDPASRVYSLGHRNVQGLAWDSDGRLWATEFGEKDVDELNLIEPGGNYGWPQCEGACDVAGVENPKATWSPTSTSSPSGLAVVADSAWVASLRGQTLYEVPLRGDSAGKPRAWFAEEYGRLRDVVAAPDGRLWVVTNNTDGRGQPSSGDDRILQVGVPEADD